MVLWVGERTSHPYSTDGRYNRGNTTCWPYKWLHFLGSQEKLRELAIEELQQCVHTVYSLLNWFQLARHWFDIFSDWLCSGDKLLKQYFQPTSPWISITSRFNQLNFGPEQPLTLQINPGNILVVFFFFHSLFFSLAACINMKRFRKMYGKDPLFEDKILLKAANL